MDNRKKLREEYKQRVVTGGVYRIVNKQNGKYYLAASVDLRGDKNLFDFSVITKSSPVLHLQKEWQKYGGSSFDFEVLEEAEKKAEQSGKEFKEDMRVLAQLWAEKFDSTLAY